MPSFTQKNRFIAIETPLGQDVLGLVAFTGYEELGRLFRFEAELVSDNTRINFEDLIGQKVSIRMETTKGQPRYFHGYVSRFTQLASHRKFARYHATIVPWLWLLTRRADCSIFQDKSVPQILQDVFKRCGVAECELRLSAKYPPRKYCVQYRETDFNFVSRLMEQEGIYYFFNHEKTKHTLVLADSPSAHNANPKYEDIIYRPEAAGTHDSEFILNWTVARELQTGVYTHTDFDFETPSKKLLTHSTVPRKHGFAKFEMFDYPGDYAEVGEGNRHAKARIQELQSHYETLEGEADARGICVGSTFTLKEHPRSDQGRKYLIKTTHHSAQAGEFESEAGTSGDLAYHCSFAAFDSAETFRPERTTPKPVVQGLQTAIVTGPKDQEIYVDKFGRVKVKFHWDRSEEKNEKSSCWVRVSQAWAGKNWGAIYIPRIGQEVMVEFLEGDPDLPIITGRVYNGEAMPPYDLPGEMTKSTLKSNSTKGGDGFNEIRFEDKKGEEQIFIHSEKNVDIRVKNDTFETIGNDRHLIIKKDQIEHVENNRDEVVDADHKEKIGKDRHLQVMGKEAKAVVGSLSLTVNGDVIEVFKSNHSEQTTSDYYLKADNVVIEGMTNVTIKVGQSYIAIEASGIKISGPQLEIEGQATVDVKSPMTTVKADGMLTLKGGMTMIN